MTPQEETMFALEKRLREVEERLALYELNGLADTFSGAGNQTYGGGRMRLDKSGIQIVDKAGNTSPGIYFLPEFVADPPSTLAPNSTQWSGIAGNASASDNWASLEARRMSGTQPSYAYVKAYSDGGSSSVTMKAIMDNGAKSEIALSGAYNTNPARAEISGAVVLKELENKTIATGAITVTATFQEVDTEAAAATDDLDTINGGIGGQLLIISPVNDTRTVVVKDGTGNLRLAGDFTMDNTDDTMILICDSAGNWLELSRSDNGA